MEKVGRFEVYSFDEVVDKAIGPKGTPRRDKIEAEAAEALHAYRMGEAIKNARLDQKLTQEQLGKKTGVNRSQISRLERGKNTSLSSMGRILKALGVPAPTLDLGAAGKVALW